MVEIIIKANMIGVERRTIIELKLKMIQLYAAVILKKTQNNK